MIWSILWFLGAVSVGFCAGFVLAAMAQAGRCEVCQQEQCLSLQAATDELKEVRRRNYDLG